MPFLRQSTAQTILFGPCLDKTDGVTEETALTLAQADMRLSKDGGTFAEKSAAGNATHDSDGWYNTTFSTTDTATVGELLLNVHQPANMLPVWLRFFVVEEEVYDDIFAASAVGYLKPVTGGNDLDVTATGAAGIDWGNIENKATANDLSATDIQLVDTCTVNTDVRGTDSALLASAAPTNFGDLSITVTTGLVDITQTAADKVWATAARILTASTNFNDISAADVNAQVVDVLKTDTIAEIAQGVPAATPTFENALMLMYMALRNKLDVATVATDTLEIHNDAGTRIAQKLLTDDGTDYSEAKMISGA